MDTNYTAAVLDEIESLTEHPCYFSGSFPDSKVAVSTAQREVYISVGLVIIFGVIMLSFTLSSFPEVMALLFSLLVAVLLNNGTNIVFGTISSTTRTASSVLQMAVSMDYSIFLLHRFDDFRKKMGKEEAMTEAMTSSRSSVFSSSVTTMIGFLSLVFMRYRLGMDMGVVLAKGVAFSLLTAFTLMPCLVVMLDPLIQKHHHRPVGEHALRIRTASRSMKRAGVIIFLVTAVGSLAITSGATYYYGSSHLYKDTHEVMTDRAAIEQVFGRDNTLVLLVPKEDTNREIRLIEDIKAMPSCRNVTSYTEIFGPGIPEEMIPDYYRGLFRSDKYSRILLSFDLEDENDETFRTIADLRALAASYYGNDAHLIGSSVSSFDLKETISADNIRINLIIASAIFLVLIITLRSFLLPVILTLCVEGSAWICMAISTVTGQPLFYIGYLIVTSILIGCTVDYAILITNRYKELRKGRTDTGNAVYDSVELSASSVVTSGMILVVAGIGLRIFSTNQLVAQLGELLSRGTATAVIVILFALPGLLSLYDRVTRRRIK